MIGSVDWRVEPGLLDYPTALAAMEARVAAIRAGDAAEQVWLVEHPPLYTAGTSASIDELVDPDRFPVHRAGRGGRYTYHGPGQRVGYVMLDLNRRGRDVRCFVDAIERWIVAALADLGIEAFVAPGRIGVWVRVPGGEAKVAAIGVRVRRWVTFHGFSINVAPDLTHFGGIVPCGLADYGVTSLRALGIDATLGALDQMLVARLPGFLGRLGPSAIALEGSANSANVPPGLGPNS